MRDLSDVPSGESGWAHDHPAAAAQEFLARHPEFEMRQPEWKVNTGPLTQNITYWPDGWASGGKFDAAGEIQKAGLTGFGPGGSIPSNAGGGLRTTAIVPPAVTEIFDTRLRMVEPTVSAHFGARVQGLECLDIGCHEGFYALAMARLGMKVHAVDAREENPLNRVRVRLRTRWG